jgi:hypothetical protein
LLFGFLSRDGWGLYVRPRANAAWALALLLLAAFAIPAARGRCASETIVSAIWRQVNRYAACHTPPRAALRPPTPSALRLLGGVVWRAVPGRGLCGLRTRVTHFYSYEHACGHVGEAWRLSGSPQWLERAHRLRQAVAPLALGGAASTCAGAPVLCTWLFGDARRADQYRLGRGFYPRHEPSIYGPA